MGNTWRINNHGDSLALAPQVQKDTWEVLEFPSKQGQDCRHFLCRPWPIKERQHMMKIWGADGHQKWFVRRTNLTAMLWLHHPHSRDQQPEFGFEQFCEKWIKEELEQQTHLVSRYWSVVCLCLMGALFLMPSSLALLLEGGISIHLKSVNKKHFVLVPELRWMSLLWDLFNSVLAHVIHCLDDLSV